jgi:hypothetical protein
MKSLYDTNGSVNGKASSAADQERSRPARAERPEDGGPAETVVAAGAPSSRSGKKNGVKILGTINLILLAVIIGFQVKIVLWQTGITDSLKRLENEVNQEKIQRVELGNDLLKKIEETTAPAVPPAVSAAYRTNQPAALYAQHNAKSKQLAKLKKGQEVTVEGEEGPWRKVSGDNKSGWVHSKYLTKTK